MMLAIPIAPTRSATAPRPSNSVVNWPLMAARASSASDGRLTWTPLVCRCSGGVGVIGRILSGRAESCGCAGCGCGADRSGGW